VRCSIPDLGEITLLSHALLGVTDAALEINNSTQIAEPGTHCAPGSSSLGEHTSMNTRLGTCDCGSHCYTTDASGMHTLMVDADKKRLLRDASWNVSTVERGSARLYARADLMVGSVHARYSRSPGYAAVWQSARTHSLPLSIGPNVSLRIDQCQNQGLFR
jgi:hypothetical protein